MRTRKRGWFVLGGVVALAGAALLPASAGPQVMVNGEMVKGVRVYNMGGRTMVPVREVIERIPGATVQWTPERREIVVSNRGQRTVLHTQSGIARVSGRNVSGIARVNGRDVFLDAPIVMRKGSILMPVRFVEDVLGAKVDYNRATKLVSITTDDTETMSYRAAPATYAAPATPEGAVAIGGETVISFLHPGVYSSVRERAGRVTELLTDGLTQIGPQSGGKFSAGRVRLSENDGNPVIMMGNVSVVTVTADDAMQHKTTQRALANEWLKRIQSALVATYGNTASNR